MSGDITDDTKPRPPATEGLSRLDQDRALSIADEGGASAAVLESQEPAVDWPGGKLAGALAIGAFAGLALWWLLRRSSR